LKCFGIHRSGSFCIKEWNVSVRRLSYVSSILRVKKEGKEKEKKDAQSERERDTRESSEDFAISVIELENFVIVFCLVCSKIQRAEKRIACAVIKHDAYSEKRIKNIKNLAHQGLK